MSRAPCGSRSGQVAACGAPQWLGRFTKWKKASFLEQLAGGFIID